jgi:hypothetical protein
MNLTTIFLGVMTVSLLVLAIMVTLIAAGLIVLIFLELHQSKQPKQVQLPFLFAKDLREEAEPEATTPSKGPYL